MLASLPPDELASLQPHLRKVELRRGTVLHQPRAPIERVYFPASGMVSLLMVMRSGEAIETAVTGREGAVGASVANDASESYGQAIMQIAGLAAEMSGTAFSQAYHERAELRGLIDRFEGLILLQAQQSAACHALHGVEARLCRCDAAGAGHGRKPHHRAHS